MSSNAERRLLKDLQKMQKSEYDGIQACPSDDNLMKWDAIIQGTVDTEWEGGIFRLSMVFTDQYPNKPPEVKFLTEIFHPNVYASGNICLDILMANWMPSYDVSSILISV